MKGSNRPALNASNKDAVSVVLMMLDKVSWSLLGRDSDERYALVSRFEPDYLRLVLLAVLMMAPRVSFALLPLSFLFLFGRLTTRP